MILSRILEEKLGSLYRAGGRIVGGVYLGRGQEAFSAAAGNNLRYGKDVYGPLIRDQAGRIAYGEPLLDTLRTYLGVVTGPMRGRDGNIHRGRPKDGYMAMISHLGSLLSVVAGALFARRLRGTLEDSVGATSIGDGGTSTGAFHEGLNMAAVEKLPLVVSIANNQFAYSTPTTRQYACEDLVDRAIGYGVEGYSVDGTDLLACVATFRTAFARARAGHGPQLVVGRLLRLGGHGEHDDASYIPDSAKHKHEARDCIEVAKKQALEFNWATEADFRTWEEEARRDVDAAQAIASKEPTPDPYRETWHALSTSELVEGQHG
ncbi:thiamine pyrophosphate-dependent dehydrogenase E1 component subunit alpha [Prosthecobacter dejongeii]|uniref:2-oxoisovalerate dehydrogenase subunit alpha n=1 Tax=Prosthecobacter dejongeii TaxID=48465 RepID=A0A7W7YNQ4_9BACT|nr:thiamine pyrophosphate-dependent dehydrogenase E1 component subunit alpha [Prosthecobacter dejongeii]MBB5039449.1 pyruvate dehydrogenase E1 component alpha subunit/2-oxoisovalerate dehydrogenase E1 component alpha subunit [Prosthecobacter dejongeii]